MKEKINKRTEIFIGELTALFYEIPAALSTYNYGMNFIDTISKNTTITYKIGVDLWIEPLPINEIKIYKDNYINFILEVYQGKIVQLWNSFLDDIFCILLDKHFDGSRQFIELRKRKIQVDFCCESVIIEQIRANVIKDYSFLEYSERLKIINNALNINNSLSGELDFIKINVLLRNSIQHHRGIIEKSIFKKIGRSKIKLLDHNAKNKVFKSGDKIIFSLPVIYQLYNSLLKVVQKWRKI